MASATKKAPRAERRRRNRRPKACRLCRTRKVRCDYQQPCGTCVLRDHPQLCGYDGISIAFQELSHFAVKSPTIQSTSKAPCSSQSPCLETPRQDGVDGATSRSGTLPNEVLDILDHVATNATASRETDADTGQVTFVGRRAHATLFRTLLEYLPKKTLPLPNSVEAIFGVTNRTISQPFVSLWNTTARVTIGDIMRSLPSAETCLRYYSSYQQVSHPFFPVIHDLGAFERNLCAVLERLVAQTEESSSSSTQLAGDLPRAELAGYALLFAVLASGCQCCLVAEDDNQLALSSRVFVACSFECLSIANMFVSPSPSTIQANLILASVICNDGNPGVTMSMLGMAAQQAQGLGMHTRCECLCSSPTCECLETVQPIWRAIMILDSRLSLTYDRVPVTTLSESYDHIQSLNCASRLEFWNCSFSLHRLQLQWQSLGSKTTHTSIPVKIIESYLKHTDQLGRFALSDKSALCNPSSVQATLEQLLFTLHLNFFEGTLHLHAAISPLHSTTKRVRHFHAATSNFCLVIKSYLKLWRLSPIAKLSWDVIRAFKSSAIMLAAFEVILRDNLSGGVLKQLAKLMENGESLRTWRDDPVPSSCQAGVETLRRLLALRYPSPVADPDDG
ncbi:hypothetical protein BT63DRAFT_261924 [Microthyrium microscopicum]|uniref:Zn(2)-C6 fungal-type domain-containing protein n=1 Tax=Microthyrium microscopicum TaxID=703497 RepID=A0A6A6UBD2_9PEZI|nr:hypothetical protein BT63DRAFT_261924 [Microthyrium microscopicum]